jgi:hypothetical protein
MAKDYIGFTLDLRKLVSVLAQDPQCRAEIIEGLNGVTEPLTSQLGAANMGATDSPLWYSVFPASVEGKESGQEGLFYRNNSHEGKGDRIQMRLKMQTERATAPAQPQYQVPVPQAMPQDAGAATAAAAVAKLQEDPERFAQLLAIVRAEQGGAQLNSSTEVQARVAPTPEPAGPQYPADIAKIINKTG